MSNSSVDFLRRSEEIAEEGRRIRAEFKRLIAEAKQRVEHLQWLVSSIRRQRDKDFHRPLEHAIQAMHQCKCRHAASFAVRKVDQSQILWEGMVEEFALIRHPTAQRCYAWHYLEGGRKESFSLLKRLPIDSPQRAVQLFLLAREQPFTELQHCHY